MEIKKKIDGNKLIVELIGRLDTNTSPEFEKEINENINEISQLTLDFKELNYISSAGLRVILSLQKIMNKQGDMIIINPNDMIMEIFDSTGFERVLTIK
ncbi:MAG: STAS domain-containing protein [Methanobrevibacter sp.]|jgi:anti-sigma B factor antagonist|nr:STAS domain-containing protein [Candidatus Methanoflexus mossambicus]